ncbi:hypothetical protein [Alkalicoccus urumqiensis]|uniref:DUF4367 domain-containing protein n=1 Tax=Alkalicoccus urumqiensis TaxID=1548213 RepID=A0A2P6MI38_ALKUR|nr:hypothetical protein [Alkalicoccus urumqiensis]PRO65913.1 hypothetical protein C6I21_06305 [Alkalicoccus urumqiensis]
MRIRLFFLFLLTAGCSTFSDEPPYSLMDSSFSYDGFVYPEQWEMVAMAEIPSESGEMPVRYAIRFGEKAGTNEVSEATIDDFNQESGERRQLYYHTYYAHYADFTISENGLSTPLAGLEGTGSMIVKGTEVLMLEEEGRWAANWFQDGTYYELLLHREAGVQSEAEFRQIVEGFLTSPEEQGLRRFL